MTRVFLVMVVSAMLVTLGFTQTPDAAGNMVAVNVKGCLGGSEGNYTVVEDGTGQLFKTTSSTVDLKTHLGHDVKLTGQKTTGAADNSLAVTELSMISEHCAAAAAAAPAVTVDPSPQTSIPPDAAAAAPVTPPPATATAPAVDPAAPAATVNPAPAVAACTSASNDRDTRCRDGRTSNDGQSICADRDFTHCGGRACRATLSACAQARSQAGLSRYYG